MDWLFRLRNEANKRVERFGNQYFLFGIFGAINYPIFYIIWVYLASQTYENSPLRFIATTLCIPLIFHRLWPSATMKWQALYWYITLAFCLPFFFTFMLLKNNATDVWLMSTTIVTVWLMLLVDSISFIVLLVIGTGSAILWFHYTSKTSFHNANIVGLMYQYFGSLAVVLIFARQKNRLYERNLRIKAEAGSKAKSEFIANMSHDLRTPLTGMIGMVEGILNKSKKADHILLEKSNHESMLKIKQVLAEIRSDGTYLKSSTNQLLQLCIEILKASESDYMDTTQDIIIFNINTVLKNIIDLLCPLAKTKGIALGIYNDDKDDIYVSGNKKYFERAMLNVVSNALKFTQEGGVSIYSRVEKKTNEVVNLQIKVKDTGIGIPKDKYEEIFNHFTRLKPSYEGGYEGAGLGLYTVKQYIAKMGGTIELSSEEGAGSVFTIQIPFSKPVAPACCSFDDNTQPDSHKKNARIRNEAAALSVLVVEDNEPAALAAKRFLEPLGCEVDIADTAQVGIDMLEQKGYRIIFLDIGLPDMSGIEATQIIRSLTNLNKAKTPIIALTGHGAEQEVTVQALEAGVQEVIVKPATSDVFERVLDQYCN